MQHIYPASAARAGKDTGVGVHIYIAISVIGISHYKVIVDVALVVIH